MKKKDIITLVGAVAIFGITGLVAASQLGWFGGSQGKTVIVEVAPVIKSGYSQSALDKLADPTQVSDFTVSVDLSRLGSPSPFQPF